MSMINQAERSKPLHAVQQQEQDALNGYTQTLQHKKDRDFLLLLSTQSKWKKKGKKAIQCSRFYKACQIAWLLGGTSPYVKHMG